MQYKNQKGFTVMESLVAVLIFSMSGLAFSSFVSISANMQNRNKTKLAVSQVKGHVLAMIANKSVWYRNLRDANIATHPSFTEHTLNPELACLRDGTPCTEDPAGYNLTLTDQSGNIVIDGVDQTKGFTNDGAACTGYNASAPNPACPWRLSLKWVPLCPASGACVHPQVTINLEVIASSEFIQSSSLTTTQLSLMLEQPKVQPPIAKRMTLITNSVHYGYPSDLAIDPSAAVISDTPGRLTFSLPSLVSNRGATLELVGNTIVYKPEYAPTYSPVPSEKLYGGDHFTYKVQDSYTGVETLGTIYVEVMTPYTWTGLATGDTSVSTKKNYCGKVVDGVCDGVTFPASFLNAAPETNLVFNELCTVCNVDISSQLKVRSIELAPTFAGTITQRANVAVMPDCFGRGFVWPKNSAFLMKGGNWNGESGQMAVTCRGEGPDASTFGSFNLQGGNFTAPSQMLVKGDFNVVNSAAFHHNNGTVYWLGTWARGRTFSGDGNTQFYNFVAGWPKTSLADDTVSIAGWTTLLSADLSLYDVNNDFTVLHDMTIANTHRDSTLGNPSGSANVNLKGNLILSQFNAGGSTRTTVLNVTMNGDTDQSIIGQNLTETERQDPDRVNCAPSIVVNKTSGQLIAKDSIVLRGNLIFQNAGGYQMQNTNVIARGSEMTVDLKGQEVDGLYYTASYGGGWMYIGSDLTVNKMFYWNTPFSWSVPEIYNRVRGVQQYINIKGDAIFGEYAVAPNFGYDYTAILNFNGTANQTLTSRQINQYTIVNSIHINKPSGLMNFVGKFGISQDFFVTSGNLNFDPAFVLYVKEAGANGLVNQISMNDPVNQKIPNLELYRSMRPLTPVYVGNLKYVSNWAWWGQIYDNFYGGISPVYVSGDLSVDTLGLANPMSANGGDQTLILNGTGAQNISFAGIPNGAVTSNKIDLQIQNTSSSHVTISGTGTAARITVGAGSTVDLAPTSDLGLTGTVAGVLNKNGKSPSGSLAVVGAGVINN
jgi:hypothetical protein